MKCLGCLLILLVLGPDRAFGLYFGTNVVRPGQLVEFDAPPSARARFEVGQMGKMPPRARGAFILPAGVTNLLRPVPILIVSVPSGGGAIAAMRTMTNVAWTEGWIVFAAEGPKVAQDDDTIQWGWAMLSSALEQFAHTWPPTRQWPIACAGFSGGAKRSAAVAAATMHEGWRVIGVFMGGCNEDRATLGLELFQPGPRFLRVPMFLSNGDQDRIAGPTQGAAVRDAMTRSGFTVLRAEIYSGSHQLDQEHLRTALQWFRQAASAR